MNEFDFRATEAYCLDDDSFTRMVVRRYRRGRRAAFFEEPEICTISFFGECDYQIGSVTEDLWGDFVISFDSLAFPMDQIWYCSSCGMCSFRPSHEEHGDIFPSRRAMIEHIVGQKRMAR